MPIFLAEWIYRDQESQAPYLVHSCFQSPDLEIRNYERSVHYMMETHSCLNLLPIDLGLGRLQRSWLFDQGRIQYRSSSNCFGAILETCRSFAT